MARLNKTTNNLKLVAQQLDEASGSLYNALDNLSKIRNLGDQSDLKDIPAQIDRIDPTAIDVLRQSILELIEEKEIRSEGE
ncbi:hypothetical protein IEN91_04865 [Bacillus velezensis]|uniref:hypothetical protein n=1 Tax=Bacillus velezensis TaxID=492670 RepID=UPI0018C48EA0|nr:hypothetical protein [Bacillus velezensis]QPK89776.1 hypothetical protein IEN91_04865 [Bacillus velezensis]